MRPVFAAVTIASLFLSAGCDSTPMVPEPLGTPPAAMPALWTVSGSSAALLRFDPRRLSNAPPEADAVVTTPSANLNTLAAAAFDSAGSLWIVGFDEPVLIALAPAALDGAGSQVARTTIGPVAGSLESPTALAFDSRQRLWVADYSGRISRFDVGQLSSGGAQQPTVVLNVPGNPVSMAFDATGSLWVSDNVLHEVSKYSPAQLAYSGSPVPDVVLSTNGLSLLNPAGLAFDADGNLWVANIGGRSLASFSQAQLAYSGSPFPAVEITTNDGSLSVPVGLAFDATGDLWVIGGTGALTKFSRASLGASGSPIPSVRTQVPGHSVFWSLAFWPIPTGLPLGQR